MRNGHRTRHVLLLTAASAAVGTLAANSSADVLVYESFNSYSPGNLVDAGAPVAATGIGLTGNYTSASVGASDSISVVPGGLSFSTLNTSAGNALQLTAGDSAAIAAVTLAPSVGTLSDQTLWGSYLVQPTSPGAATSAVAEVRIASSATASATNARLRAVSDSSNAASGGTFMPAVGMSGNGLGSSGSLLVNLGTYLLVSKFTRVGATLDVANPGVAKLWAMDVTQYDAFIAGGGNEAYLDAATVAGGQLSAFATHSVTSGTPAFTGGNFVQLVDGWGAAGGNTPQTYVLDEVRYGTSLADVGGTPGGPGGAGTFYWDIDGPATPGGGGATPTGNWDGVTANFNSDAAGGASGSTLAVTTASTDVVFAAGTDGGGTYTVTVSGMQAANSVAVARGNVTLDGGTLATGTFDVAAGASASVTSVVTGGASNSLTQSGTGTLFLSGANSYTGTTTVTGGTLSVNAAAAAPLITGAGGTDIQSGRVVFEGGDAAAIRGLLTTSYNGGTNAFQAGQIRSTTIAPNRALGYIDNGTNVAVMYTVNGDANLSGGVSIADVNIAKANFGGTGDVWATGDFNYDGVTTIAEINITKANFGVNLPLMAGDSSSRSAALQADGSAGPDQIELIVNIATGQIQMVGNDADPGEITSYEVRSLSGSLNVAGYTSLADQARPGWGELPGTNFLVGEDHGFTSDTVNLAGFTLGNLLAPGGTQDLAFNYGNENFLTVAGIVTYVPEPTGVSLVGLGALSLLGWRRRRA